MKTRVYAFLSLLFLSILCGFMYYNNVLVDTQAYVPSVYYLQGVELLSEDVERVTGSYAFKRPIEIAFAAVFEPFVGVRQAYSVLNIIIYCATTLLFWYFTKQLFVQHERKELIAYISAVIYATSLPLILYATRVLVDVAAYLTLLIGLLVIAFILEKENVRWYHHLLLSMLFGVFLLVRDAVVILYPYYVLQYYLKEKKEKYKEKKIFTKAGYGGWSSVDNIVALWPFLLTLLPQITFMVVFDVGFLLSGKEAAITAGKYSFYGWLKFLLVHIAAFHIAYLFAYFGIRQETDSKRKLFYWLYGFCAAGYLISIQLIALTSPRFSMVLFPVIIPLASIGILMISSKVHEKYNAISPVTIMLCCLLFYAILSFIGAWLYPGRMLIAEDAGGNTLIAAVFNELKYKLATVFS